MFNFIGFVNYLFEECPDVIDSALDEQSDDSFVRLVRKLKLVQHPISLSCKETAAIMMGKCDMSQRSYKVLKSILQNSSVIIPTYDKLRAFCKGIDVGPIKKIHESKTDCFCMGFSCTVKDTLQRIFYCKILKDKMEFPTEERQNSISLFLKVKDPKLYKNFDAKCRTLFIRDTGDNFRACSRYPTEQISFSLLNIPDLVNCPYGQFITNLWRGMECRESLEEHAAPYYNELSSLVSNGVDLTINDKEEHFNVVVFLVADLSFVKEILGKCSCTQSFGCFHCELNIKQWSAAKIQKASPQSIEKMKTRGKEALALLGSKPNKDSCSYKKVTAGNFGQWVCWNINCH